jgi:hypothetical protein
LIVGDYFKSENAYVETIGDAMEVIKWFNNHTLANGLLKKEQEKQTGKVLSLLVACLTRWTSHYLSCNRLLALEKPLRSLALFNEEELVNAAGQKVEQQKVAEGIVRFLQSPPFWDKLKL